jgi:hypothetical protein
MALSLSLPHPLSLTLSLPPRSATYDKADLLADANESASNTALSTASKKYQTHYVVDTFLIPPLFSNKAQRYYANKSASNTALTTASKK